MIKCTCITVGNEVKIAMLKRGLPNKAAKQGVFANRAAVYEDLSNLHSTRRGEVMRSKAEGRRVKFCGVDKSRNNYDFFKFFSLGCYG